MGCDKVRHSGTGIRASCPLAFWTHSGGKDKHPSFYVFIDEYGRSYCGCLSSACRFKGSLGWLVKKLEEKSGKKRPSLRRMLDLYENGPLTAQPESDDEEAEDPIPDDSWYAKREPQVWEGGKDYTDPLVVAAADAVLSPEAVVIQDRMIEWLDTEAIDYLTGPRRRFTRETIRKWRLGWHPLKRRISVPQYDHLNRLVNISGRFLPYWPIWTPPSDWEAKAPKWLHSNGFNRELYLFGEDNFQLGDKKGTVFLSEGAFDVIYLDQCGIPNPAAINGSYINKIQLEKIVKWFDQVVLLMDGDPDGLAAGRRLLESLSPRLHTQMYEISGGRDPNELTDEEVDFLKATFVR